MSHKIHKLCTVCWMLGNLPPDSSSALPSIYQALLCKSDDVKAYGMLFCVGFILQQEVNKICFQQLLVTAVFDVLNANMYWHFINYSLKCFSNLR